MKKNMLVFAGFLFLSFGAAAQDTTSYKEMVGKYIFAPGNVIPDATVVFESGVLSMSSLQGASPLERIKGDTFNVVNFSGICVFKRNEAKKITGVHVDASGYVMEGEKEAVKLYGYKNNDVIVSREQLTKVNEVISQSMLNNTSFRKPFLALVYN